MARNRDGTSDTHDKKPAASSASHEGVCLVFDVGKTFSKVSIVDRHGKLLNEKTTVTPRLNAHLYAAFDVDTLFEWLLAKIKVFAASYIIDRIMPITHGATCALMGEDGALLQPVQDYEATIPSLYREAYRAVRPDFNQTLSPYLPNGLNIGCQIYWHAHRDPRFFSRVRWILMYPQYWTWRLSGELVSEVTSFGCHTDLWNPKQKTYSSLMSQQGWEDRFPPMQKAWDVAGTIRPELADVTGLPKSCKIMTGLHDTNAALTTAIMAKKYNPDYMPPALLSTGTWFIALNPLTKIDTMASDQDCLGFVDVFSEPIVCARFMGGRAYELISNGMTKIEAELPMIQKIIDDEAFAMPSFDDAGGLYSGYRGEIRGLKSDTHAHRAALGHLYLALLSRTCLDLIQADGPLVIEGVAARYPHLCGLISALSNGTVFKSDAPNEVIRGAAMLAFLNETPPPIPLYTQVEPILAPEVRHYREIWLAILSKTEKYRASA